MDIHMGPTWLARFTTKLLAVSSNRTWSALKKMSFVPFWIQFEVILTSQFVGFAATLPRHVSSGLGVISFTDSCPGVLLGSITCSTYRAPALLMTNKVL